MTSADYKVQGVRTVADNQPQWYYWVAIIAVVGLVLGYAVWEWREELRVLWNRVRGFVKS